MDGSSIAVASLKTHRLILTVPNDGPVDLASNLPPAEVPRILRHLADQVIPYQTRQTQ